jgi:precorrin 3B synthase CobZ
MAREAGASVTLVEWAPRHFRGGNSRHTRNIRSMHEAPTDVLTDAYPEEEYWQDLLKVTGGITDERLARMAIRHTGTCRPWMMKHGVRFQPALGGTLHVSRTNAFFLGGGKALLNAYYRSAEALGIRVFYDTEVTDVELEGASFKSATVIARRCAARDPREGGGGRVRRLRVQPGVAEGGLGPAGRQLHRARHALQHGARAEAADRQGCPADRRPDAGPLRGHRRALAQVRRRHRDAASTACRSASS